MRKKKKEIVSDVTNLLKQNGIRKPVNIPKYALHITDDEGNHADFDIKRINKSAIYTVTDVQNILDALVDYIVTSIKHGDEVFFNGFGVFKPEWRSERRTKHPTTKEPVVIPPHYIITFKPGDMLRTAVKLYDLAVKDGTLAGCSVCQDDEEYDDLDSTNDATEYGDDL